MVANRTVAVVLKADTGQFQAGLLKASSQVRMLGTDTDAATSRADRGFRQASQGASLFGGALKTAAAAGAGLAAANFLKGAIGAASDLNETLNKSNVIFGQNAAKIERWAQDASTNFGLSKSAALEAASGFGNMLQQLGFAGDAAVEASTGVVKLAADLGSFNNLETEDVLDRIGAAMRGEYDSLQLLVPNINAARVEQEAMAETGKENAKELTAQEKAAAVLAIVHKDGAAAADDFAETSDGLANSTKIAKAQFADLQAEIGQRFLPIAERAMGFVSSTAIPALGGAADTVFDLVEAFADLPAGVQAGIVAFGAWALAGDRVMGGLKGIGDSLSPLRSGTQAFGEALDYARANGDGLGTVLRSVGSYAGGQALTGIKALGRAIGPELAIAGITLLATEIYQVTKASGSAEKEIRALWDAVDKARGAAQFEALDNQVETLQNRVEELRTSLADDGAWETTILGGVILGDAVESKKALERLVPALNEAREAQMTAAATADDLGRKYGLNQMQVLDLAGKYGIDLTGGVGSATSGFAWLLRSEKAQINASGEASMATEVLTAKFAGMASEADNAKKQTDLFKMSLDILTGAHVSMIEVESAYQAALAESKGAMEGLDGAVLNGAGQLDLQSEKGRQASDVLLGLRDSGNQLIAQMIQQGATIEDVQVKDMSLRADFIRSAEQMGINRQAAENLANQILGIPEQRNTQINTDVTQARVNVANLSSDIHNLPDKTVLVTVKADGTVAAILGDPGQRARAGVNVGFAEGGYTGPGGKYQYAGPAHKGEVIWSQEDVAAHGGPRRVDAMRRARGYADGGIVVNFDSEPLVTTLRTVKDRLQEPATRAAGALAFARSQVGKPYIWGAAGPSGYDCSGFMSAITNFLRGKSPYSRVGSTASFPWGGFTPGYGMFTVGSSPNTGGGIGHMAGTLMGVNVESAGGVGVRVGDSARGASDRLFSTRSHLAMAGGGLIGEPVVGAGLWSGRSYSFGERGDEIVLPRSREFSGAGSGHGAPSPVAVSLVGATVSGRFEFGSDGMVTLVDGRIDQALGGLTNALSARGVRAS